MPATAAISEARNFALEWAKFSRFDADETIEAVAESICARRIEGIKIALALKLVEIVALPTSEAGVPERKIVRVLFSDGSVKYYDDGTYGEPLKYGQGEYFTDDGISGGEVDLSKIPNYVPLVANEEELPEFDYELNGFDKLADKREAEAKERQEKIARFLQAQIDAEKNVVPAPAASAE